jgi:hypothetical protein
VTVRFQVDPDFYDHPKTIDLSDAATALWTRAGSYSTAKLLDGFVPDGALTRLSKVADEASGELVRRGLWRRVRGGFQFHQWGERNLTRERIEADRKHEREKKRRQRAEAQANPNQEVNPHPVPPGHNPGHDRDSRGSPNRSVSVSVSESVSVSAVPAGHPPNGARPSPPEPPLTCPKHANDPDPPPCGPCANARRSHDRWEADRNTRYRYAPKCRKHQGKLAHNCPLCRSERIAGAA